MSTLHVLRRVVVVVAVGAVLFLVGAYLTTTATGWTGYAPLQSGPLTQVFGIAPRDGLAPLANFFVWIGLVLAWCATSLLVLRGGTWRARRLVVDAGQPLDETDG